MTDNSTDCIDPETLRRMEQAAVNGWPALESADIDGWLARVSSGGSLRANTVAALRYAGSDVAASIDRVARFYRERAARPRFTVTSVSAPVNLDQELEGRGWVRHEDHLTMAKPVQGGAQPLETDLAIGISDVASAEWMAVYLSGLTENRRAVAPRIVAGVPAPKAFVSCLRGGEVIATGLTVVEGDLASIQCMATLAQARRSGAARAVIAAIEGHASGAGCRYLYLQTETSNVPAVSLYRSIGFGVAGTYHIRELVG